MPRVSVLIPSYNHAQFLDECVRSVISQSFKDWELILVDDGSRDESLAIARALAGEDARIQIHVNERNLGTYGTLQRALELSSGELIAVLNSDDVWRPEKLAKQVKVLDQQPDCVLCYCLGDSGEHMESVFEDVHEDWPLEPVQDLLGHLFHENRILASAVLFRRQGLRFEPSCRYSGDWVALLEMARRGKFACVPERLTLWRQHGYNTYRFSPRQAQEEIRVRERIEQWAPDYAEIRVGRARNLRNLAALYVRDHALRISKRALLLHPTATEFKRWLGLRLLKFEKVQRRLWPNRDDLAQAVDPEILATAVESDRMFLL